MAEPSRPPLKITPKGGEPVKPSSPGLPKFQVSKTPFAAPPGPSAGAPLPPPGSGPSKGPALPPPSSTPAPPTAPSPPSPPTLQSSPPVPAPVPTLPPSPAPVPSLSPSPAPSLSPSPAPSLSPGPAPSLGANKAPSLPITPPPTGAPAPTSQKNAPDTPDSKPQKSRPSILFLLLDFLVFGASTAGCVLLFLNY